MNDCLKAHRYTKAIKFVQNNGPLLLLKTITKQ